MSETLLRRCQEADSASVSPNAISPSTLSEEESYDSRLAAQQAYVDKLFYSLSPDVRTIIEVSGGASLLLGGSLGISFCQRYLLSEMLSNQSTTLGLTSTLPGQIHQSYFSYIFKNQMVAKHAGMIALSAATLALGMNEIGKKLTRFFYLDEKEPHFMEEWKKLESLKGKWTKEKALQIFPSLKYIL